jgi:hypothetical protein
LVGGIRPGGIRLGGIRPVGIRPGGIGLVVVVMMMVFFVRWIGWFHRCQVKTTSGMYVARQNDNRSTSGMYVARQNDKCRTSKQQVACTSLVKTTSQNEKWHVRRSSKRQVSLFKTTSGMYVARQNDKCLSYKSLVESATQQQNNCRYKAMMKIWIHF